MRCQGVCLCYDRNQVDSCPETLHDLNIERLEAAEVDERSAQNTRKMRFRTQRVTCRPNEVKAGVHAEIKAVNALRLLLLAHVRLMLIILSRASGVRTRNLELVTPSSGLWATHDKVNDRRP